MNKGITTPIKENKEVFILFLTSIVLIFLSLYNNVFGIIAFVIDIFAIILLSPDKSIILLSSLMPWAYIYKTSLISTSLFSIIVIFTTLKFLLEIKRVDTQFIGLLIVFVLGVAMHFSINNNTMLLMFIKLIINLLLLYEMCIIHKQENVTAIIVFFVLSVVISSIIASSITNRELFLNRIKQQSVFVEFKYERFKGLQNDPNYYNSSLIICLLSLCFLFVRKEIGLSFFILSFLCIYFGILTYSKSFFVLLIAWIGVVIYYAFTKKRYSLSFILLGIGIIGIWYIFSGHNNTINTLISRFSDSAGVTTGRTDTWQRYGQYFVENPMILLFGNGYENFLYNGVGSHNSYIDMILFFGAFGTIVFIAIIRNCFMQGENCGRQLFAYVFAVFIFAIYFFLSGINTCEMPFILFYVFMFFDYSDRELTETAETDNKMIGRKYIRKGF